MNCVMSSPVLFKAPHTPARDATFWSPAPPAPQCPCQPCFPSTAGVTVSTLIEIKSHCSTTTCAIHIVLNLMCPVWHTSCNLGISSLCPHVRGIIQYPRHCPVWSRIDTYVLFSVIIILKSQYLHYMYLFVLFLSWLMRTQQTCFLIFLCWIY